MKGSGVEGSGLLAWRNVDRWSRVFREEGIQRKRFGSGVCSLLPREGHWKHGVKEDA